MASVRGAERPDFSCVLDQFWKETQLKTRAATVAMHVISDLRERFAQIKKSLNGSAHTLAEVASETARKIEERLRSLPGHSDVTIASKSQNDFENGRTACTFCAVEFLADRLNNENSSLDDITTRGVRQYGQRRGNQAFYEAFQCYRDRINQRNDLNCTLHPGDMWDNAVKILDSAAPVSGAVVTTIGDKQATYSILRERSVYTFFDSHGDNVHNESSGTYTHTFTSRNDLIDFLNISFPEVSQVTIDGMPFEIPSIHEMAVNIVEPFAQPAAAPAEDVIRAENRVEARVDISAQEAIWLIQETEFSEEYKRDIAREYPDFTANSREEAFAWLKGKYEALSPDKQDRYKFTIWDLAGQPQGDPNYGGNHLYDNWSHALAALKKSQASH